MLSVEQCKKRRGGGRGRWIMPRRGHLHGLAYTDSISDFLHRAGGIADVKGESLSDAVQSVVLQRIM